MRVPCPACSILWRFDRFDACPLCGREPPRGVRDPGPDRVQDLDAVADGGARALAAPIPTSAPVQRVDLEADDLPVGEFVDVEKRPVVVQARRVDERTEVDTREGTVVAEAGDVLMQGVEGEVYPCDADIFAETYRWPTSRGGRP